MYIATSEQFIKRLTKIIILVLEYTSIEYNEHITISMLQLQTIAIELTASLSFHKLAACADTSHNAYNNNHNDHNPSSCNWSSKPGNIDVWCVMA